MLNSILLDKIWLKKEEVPILVIRRSSLNWLWPYFIGGLLLASAFFLMAYLWRYGWAGLLLFVLMILLAAYILARALYERYYTCWVLTNLRLIDLYQRGFLRRENSEAIYDKLKDIHGAKSGLFGLGDISVALDNSRVKLLLKGVRGYERAVSEIILQQENYEKNLSDEKEGRAQYQLLKIKNKIGAAAFNRLLGD